MAGGAGDNTSFRGLLGTAFRGFADALDKNHMMQQSPFIRQDVTPQVYVPKYEPLQTQQPTGIAAALTNIYNQGTAPSGIASLPTQQPTNTQQ